MSWPNRLLRHPRPSLVLPAPKSSDLGKALAALRQPRRRSCHGQAPDRARAPSARARVRSQGSARRAVCAMGIRAGSLRRCHGWRFCCRCWWGRSASVRRAGCGVRAQVRCNCPQRGGRSCSSWESNSGAGGPFGHQGAAPSIPQTEDEAKALIRSVFGQSTIFKPVE